MSSQVLHLLNGLTFFLGVYERFTLSFSALLNETGAAF